MAAIRIAAEQLLAVSRTDCRTVENVGFAAIILLMGATRVHLRQSAGDAAKGKDRDLLRRSIDLLIR